MKKSVLCMLLCILLLPIRGIAEAPDPTGFDLTELAEDTVFLVNANDPSHAILGIERNADVKRYPASTTKIMTCILALERCGPEELVTVSRKACNLSERNSKMGLKPGETFRMIDLLYGLMLPSGNDAAIAIAEHVGGSVSGFAELMNAKAKALGMENTHYVNPHGLHHSDHYTTARDMALLTAYALENETFRIIVGTREHTVESLEGRKIDLLSSNRLLRDIKVSTYKPYSCLYPYAIGVKTGDTHLAGKCLVAAAARGDTVYILVLLNGQNAPDNAKGREKDKYAAQRFYDAAKIFDYAFANDTVEIDISYLKERCLPETYAYVPDPHDSLIREALYRIEWTRENTLILPCWQAENVIADPFPDEYIRYSEPDLRVPLGEKAGTVVIEIDGQTLFTGVLIADDYTYPPTAAPTVDPTYIVSDETPVPGAGPETPAVSPSLAVPSSSAAPDGASEWIPVEPEPYGSGCFGSLFRCAP